MLRINPHDPTGGRARGWPGSPTANWRCVAAVLQFVLGLDLGLSDDEFPAQQQAGGGRDARVLAWANGGRRTPAADARPAAGSRGSRGTLPGLVSRSAGAAAPATPMPPRLPVSVMDESAMLPPSGSSMVPPGKPAVLPPEEAESSSLFSPRDESSSLFPQDESSLLPHESSSLLPHEEPAETPPGNSSILNGNSSILHGGDADLPPELVAGEDDEPGISPEESSLLPHDELPPKPPAIKRPGSSAVF